MSLFILTVKKYILSTWPSSSLGHLFSASPVTNSISVTAQLTVLDFIYFVPGQLRWYQLVVSQFLGTGIELFDACWYHYGAGVKFLIYRKNISLYREA